MPKRRANYLLCIIYLWSICFVIFYICEKPNIMKRIIITLLCAVLCVCSYAQQRDSVGVNWLRMSYVDSFGDDTGGYYYVSQIALGRFSNSATTGDDLAVLAFVKSDSNVYFKLFEYLKHPVSEPFTKVIAFEVKDAAGNKGRLAGFVDHDRIELNKKDSRKFYAMLMAGGTIQLVGYASTATYKFSICADDFAELAKTYPLQ